MHRVSMAKKRKRNHRGLGAETAPKPLDKTALWRLFALVGATVAALTVYYFLIDGPYFGIVLTVYLVLGTIASLGYVIYNRGFSRRGVTEDMLPADWSDEKKRDFIEDGARRMKRSRWLLIVAFAIFATLAVDMIGLYVLPTFRQILGISR